MGTVMILMHIMCLEKKESKSYLEIADIYFRGFQAQDSLNMTNPWVVILNQSWVVLIAILLIHNIENPPIPGVIGYKDW
jgi:hypothetical protein